MMLEGRLRTEVLEEREEFQEPRRGLAFLGEHRIGNPEVDPNCPLEQDCPWT